MSIITSGVTNGGSDAMAKWETVAAELRRYRDQQRAIWGNLDDLVVARYIANEASAEERTQVEAAMDQYPAVKAAIEVIREICKEEDKKDE